MVILSMHVMYLPTSPCLVVPTGKVLCLVTRTTTVGGSYQGDSCVLSTLNKPLTKHVGIGSQEISLNRVLHMKNVQPIHSSVCFGRVQPGSREDGV